MFSKQCSTKRNNAQPKSANRIGVFLKIDQLDWNHKPICEISKVCVNLIPNLKYHNPESWTHNSRFFLPKKLSKLFVIVFVIVIVPVMWTNPYGTIETQINFLDINFHDF